MTVTATRDLREVFRTPTPVSVVDATTLARRAPANITDLCLDLPGLDVNGVGPSQSRPIIRGLLGQRILLLEDGIRVIDARRDSDFGEIPTPADLLSRAGIRVGDVRRSGHLEVLPLTGLLGLSCIAVGSRLDAGPALLQPGLRDRSAPVPQA